MRAECGNSGDLMTGLQTVVCPLSLPLSADPKVSLQLGLELRTGSLEADKSAEARCVSQIR